MTKYVMLRKNLKKKLRNQRVHILDYNDKTYCQTENTRRSKPISLVSVENPPKGIRVCIVCEGIQEASFREQSLSVLMGEAMV